MSLSKIQSLRIAVVLEDCSQLLDILGLFKLVKECEPISQQMVRLCFELKEKQSFSSFLQVVEEKKEQKNNKARKREIDVELEQRGLNLRRLQQEMHNKCEELQKLSSYCGHLQNVAALRKKTMQVIRMQKPVKNKSCVAEKRLEAELELLQKQMKEERRVHEESEKFLKNQHKELQQDLEDRQQLTKQMLQEKEDQLNNISCKKTLHLDRMMEKRRVLKVMEQVVMEDIKEQEQLRQKQAEVTAAIKLQVWWRRCMFRLGLGPFKKVEKKKDKTKKKKEKNKK